MVDAGTVTWEGVALAMSARRSVMFYLPEGVRPWRDQYVARVLTFFGGVYSRSALQIEQAVASVGLMGVLGKPVFALSKGYARRLMWALALLAPHPLLLMDEPFEGLDLKQTREMIPVLRKLVDGGRTLVLSIHQLHDAERVCDRFFLLSQGRKRGIGTLDELRASAGEGSMGLEDVFLALT